MEVTRVDSENSSRLNGLIFAAICGVLLFSTIAFGAVDLWALGTLCVIMAGVLVIWCADVFRTKEIVLNLNPLQLPVLGLILIGLIQLLPFGSLSNSDFVFPPVNSLSIAPYSTRLAIVQLCVYFVFLALAFISINSEKRVRRLVYMIIVFAAFMGFFGILQRLASTDDLIYGLRKPFQANPFGSFVNQHHFAAFMEMTIALPLALLFGNVTKQDKRGLLIIAAVIMGMAILFTSSRGGFLSLIGVVCFVVMANILGRKKSSKRNSSSDGDSKFRRNLAFFGGGMAIFIVIIGLAIYLADATTISRMVTWDYGSQDLGNGRTHFWSVAWQIFKDYPIIGSGLDSFGIAFPFYDTWNGQYRLEFAHNDYLQTLSDAGILGFLCVASFIYLLFKQSFRIIANADSHFLSNTAIGALAGCFGILIHSFFDFPLRTPSNSYFFLIFAVLATASIGTVTLENRNRSKMNPEGRE